MHRHVPVYTAQTDFYGRSLSYDDEEIFRLYDIEPSISKDVIQSSDASGINGAISTLYSLLTANPEQYPEQSVNDSNNNVSVYPQRNCPAGQDKLAQAENQQFHKPGSQSDGATCGHFETRYDHVISSLDSHTMCRHDDLHGNDDSFEVPYFDWPKTQEQCDDVHENSTMHQIGDTQSQNCGITIPILTGDCTDPFTELRNAGLCTSSFSHASCSQGNWNVPSFNKNSIPDTVIIDDRSKLYYDDIHYPLNSNATVVNHTSPTKTCNNYQDDNQADVSCKRRDDVHENSTMHQIGDTQSQNCGITIPSLTGDCRDPFTELRNAGLCTSSFSHASCSQGNWNVPSFNKNSIPDTVIIDDRSKLYYDDIHYPLNSNATVVNHTSPTKTCNNYQDDNQADVSCKRREGGKTPKKRGRPCTYLKYGVFECTEHGAGIILYQFLVNELRTQQTHIRWEDEQEGTFKVLDTVECSRRWGQQKQKDNMNFEKLSRALRYYYRDGLMCKVKGQRLVYKINWEVVPIEYRPNTPQHFHYC